MHEAESVTDVVALQELHLPSAGVFGPAIVAHQVVDVDTVVLGCDLERLIAERLPNSLHSFDVRPHVGHVSARDHVNGPIYTDTHPSRR